MKGNEVSDESYSIFTGPDNNVLAHIQTQAHFTSSVQEYGALWSPLTFLSFSICDINPMFFIVRTIRFVR